MMHSAELQSSALPLTQAGATVELPTDIAKTHHQHCADDVYEAKDVCGVLLQLLHSGNSVWESAQTTEFDSIVRQSLTS